MKVEPAIQNYLKSCLTDMTIKLMSYHQLHLPSEELYKELMPDQATYHIMLAAIALLRAELANSWESGQKINMVVDTAPLDQPRAFRAHLTEFTVKFPSTKWILPESLATLTPESKLGKTLLPMIEVADDLADLSYVFGSILDTMPYSNVLATIFPWVKDLVRDIKYNDPEEGSYNLIRWMKNNGLRHTDNNKARVRTGLRALELGLGSHPMPSLTKEIDRVCRSGAQAMTQYRMMKDARSPRTPDGYATIIPAHHATDASDKIQAEMRLVRGYYNGSLGDED